MVGDGTDKGGGNSQASTPRKQLSLRSTASGFSTPTNKVSVAATTVGVASHHLATQNSLATQSSLHSQHSGLPTPIDNLPDDLPEDVILHEKLGAGAFGTVFKGEWGGHSVAVKVLQTAYATDSREMDSFRQEIAVLSGLRHPNIVAFLAACTIPPDICIVEELAEGGSLHAKLHGVSGSENRCRPLPAGAVIRLAIDVAKAMVYLHPNIVHRDLKSQNVLLDADGRAKVCDFGIAKFKDRTFVSTVNGQAGTPAYMAPELFDGMNATEKVDVYSFAILLWECITGKVPWGHVPSPMQIIYYVGVLNQRPALPSDDSVPGDLVQLIEDCWVVDPKQRPGFDEVLRRLRAMQAEHVEAAMERAPEISERVGVISEVTSRPSSAASEGADEPTRAPAKGELAGDSAVSGGDQLVREGSLENPEGSLENPENTEYTGENTGSTKVGRRTSSVAIVASSTGDLKSFPVRP
jgi:serine/threonine protein kinase